MRKRNHKLNIYLNDNELNLLKEKSNNLGLNHSDYIRNIINSNANNEKDNSNKIIEAKNNTNNKIIASKLFDNINEITLVKNQIRLMGYPKLENKLQDILINLNKLLEIIRGNE